VTVFAKEDVGQLKYGPRGVTVDADGYAKAEALAQRLDTVPPRLKAHAAVKQRAKGGRVHVDASCNEVCRIRVSGFLVGRGVMPIRLAAVTRKDLPAKTTAHLAVALPVNFAQIARQHRRLRVRLRIAARDRGGNTAVKNARIRVRP
jgi:hypothetical protein